MCSVLGSLRLFARDCDLGRVGGMTGGEYEAALERRARQHAHTHQRNPSGVHKDTFAVLQRDAGELRQQRGRGLETSLQLATIVDPAARRRLSQGRLPPRQVWRQHEGMPVFLLLQNTFWCWLGAVHCAAAVV